MIGWRARLGILVPSSNTIIEPELCRIVPTGVSLHSARLKILKDTPEEIEGMTQDLDKEAGLLADARVDAVCFGCTGGSLYGGIGYDKKIIKRIEDATGIATTTTSTAVVEALKKLKAKKLSVATPYPQWLDEKVSEFLEGLGFSVMAIKGLGLETGSEDVSPERIYQFARETATAETDTVFISCTDFRALEIVERLEQDLGKPVVTSNQATLWMLLRLANLPDTLDGYGQLLRTK